MSLQAALASLRRTESGSPRGNYGLRQPREPGGIPVGAYGILDNNWQTWAQAAGMPGADVRSQVAQDRVAATKLQRDYDRYGSWEMALVAWYAGNAAADAVIRRGGKITNPRLARQVKKVTGWMRTPAAQKSFVRIAGAERQRTSKGGFVFPVAGDHEFSRGSYMDRHTKGPRSHHAIDIYAKKGTPVVSPVNGTVIKIGSGTKLGGNTVLIRGSDGKDYYFAHMDKHAKGISKGQKIMAGYSLGTVGNSGSARRTSPHLHFSVKESGKAINPYGLLTGAEASAGIYATSDYETLASTESALGGAALSSSEYETDAQSRAFGNTLPEAMIQSASDAIAGGSRKDPRNWIDPNEIDPITGISRKREQLDLSPKTLEDS